MKVSPINTINSNMNFRAKIQPTTYLKESFDKIEKVADSTIMKDLNYAKDFLDSIARISESKKVSDFKIEIDRRRADHTYTKINGRRVSGGHNERIPNVQDSYLVAEGTKNFASKLEELEPSTLDFMKAQIETAERALYDLKTRYSEKLKSDFQVARKMIFEDAK